ncbi:MAG: isoprenyl transferase [Prevotellaceae bacterium]|jgi:undecaprenyl diphosphate synthase|nr:isoprenyl transferase [Prevotellaceae bacterium]
MTYDLQLTAIPSHVAVIMDGNGRWAKRRLQNRIFGHRNAIRAVRETVETAAETGVRYLTLYTFSEENWQRPQAEVNGLMELLIDAIQKETPTLLENNIQLRYIGCIDLLPAAVREKLQQCINETAGGATMTLTLALSYSGKWDIAEACKRCATAVQQGELAVAEITAATIENCLSTAGTPPPDLLIRTGGEQRLSNFMLWQTAYTEFYFTDVLWPDFSKQHFLDALKEYNRRERRYGRTSEQLTD